MHRVTWPAVNAMRLERHALARPARDTPMADIVAAMCGAHAQVMSAAELSIGLRMNGVTRADVRRALWEERILVKTFGPRGTVHLLPARDLPMWTGALSAIPPRSAFSEGVRMSQPQTDQVIDAIGAALADAELTVDELGERVVAATGAWAGDLVMPAFQELWPRWRQEIGAAASRGLLCFGPNRGRRTTYTHPGRWLPGFRPAESDASAAELGRRYLHSYGPATPAQFARWLSAPERWADAVFSSLSGAIDRVQLEGSQSWALAGDAEPVDRQAEGVLLLPYFDPFVVGSYPRELLFPGRAGERALAGGQAGNYPVLMIDGTVAGVWHQRRSGSRIDVTVEPLGELTPAQRRGLDTQVERIGFILEGTARLTIGLVTTGPHA